MLSDLGRFEEAEQEWREVAREREHLFGASHPDMVDARENHAAFPEALLMSRTRFRRILTVKTLCGEGGRCRTLAGVFRFAFIASALGRAAMTAASAPLSAAALLAADGARG